MASGTCAAGATLSLCLLTPLYLRRVFKGLGCVKRFWFVSRKKTSYNLTRSTVLIFRPSGSAGTAKGLGYRMTLEAGSLRCKNPNLLRLKLINPFV
jgi:hypothetical protein